jgi:DNA-binding CsgD family transcriptional regulator/tetratricopeptide (TPR) repeat protein
VKGVDVSFMTLPPPLVGRNQDVDVLTELIEQVSSGAGQAMIVEGDPGSGKTRLVSVAGALASARGMRLMWGAGDEQQTVRPFGALTQVPALAGLEWGGDARSAPATEETLLAATEAFVDRIDELASSQPTLLVVDDLHLVDGASLSALGALGRRLRYLSVGLIGVARRPPRPAGVDRLVAGLESAGGWVHRLTPLGAPDQERLLTILTGGVPGTRLRRQAAVTGGNPLFLVELVRALHAEGRLTRVDGTVDTDAVELPTTFRQTILRRLGRTSASTTRILQAAAVLGHRFAVDDLFSLLEGAQGMTDALAEGGQAGLLQVSPDGYVFSHGLVRDVLYGELDRSVARQLHRRYVEILTNRRAPIPIVALHVGLAAEMPDDEAASFLERAAREVAGTDPSAAAAFLRQAVSLTSDQPAGDTLRSELATILARSGELGEAGILAREVLARDHDVALAPSLRLVLGREHLASGRTAAALAELEAAGSTLDLSPSSRREALSRVALGWLFTGDLAGAEAASRRVLDLGQRLGDDVAVSSALCTLALLADCEGRIDEAVALSRQAVARADASPGASAHWFPSHLYLAYMLMDDDRLDDAARVLRLGRQHSQRLGAVANIPAYHFGHGVLGFLSGTWDAAIAELAAGLLAAADIGSVSGLVWAQSIAAIIAVHSDDLVGAAAALASADAHMHAEIQPFWHWSLWARALLREAQGDLPGAAATMGALVEGCVLAGSLYELVELAPDMVRMSMAVGARDRAVPVVASVEQAVAVAKRDNGTAAALRCRGLLDGNPDLLINASTTYRGAGRAMNAAWAANEAAALLAAAGRRSEASVLLDEALAIYDAAGAERDLATAQGLGLDGGQGHGSGPAHGDPQRLTAAQLRVASLVAEGFTSAEIGRRLFISRRTVEGHLARIYTALGVHSRVELAMRFTGAAGREDLTRR